MSFLWMPFFIPAHIIAKLSGAPADGFSAPYQYSVAIAALCYLITGMIFLRKLLLNLFQNEWIAVLVPFAFFYGTNLFFYTYYLPSHAHVYSFALITLFVYFAHRFFQTSKNKWTSGVWLLCCLVMIVSVRPLNVLVVLMVPAFIPKHFFKKKLSFGTLQVKHMAVALLALAALWHQYSILYKQTGTFFPDTYSNERFYFWQPKLFDVLFSYHAGLFVYVPLMIMAVAGIFFMPSARQKFWLTLTFFLVIYLYSAWWYWPIISRTLIDFFVIPALFTAALLKRMNVSPLARRAGFTLLLLTTVFFQFKAMQKLRGVLDPNYTYSELYWKHFFRWKPARVYAIPPKTIIREKSYSEDFDHGAYSGALSDKQAYSGKHAAVLNDHADYTKAFTYKIPEFFKDKGLKKIRFSFHSYYGGNISSVQLAINVYDKNNQQLSFVPFYIQKDLIHYDNWDLEQYGRELSDAEIAAGADHVSIYFWNSDMKNEMFIDDARTEFILTDKSYEIVSD